MTSLDNMVHEIPELSLDLDTCHNVIRHAEDTNSTNSSFQVPDLYFKYLTNKIYAKIDHAIIMKFWPDSWLNWHKDVIRTAAINVLLTDNHSSYESLMINPATHEVHNINYTTGVPLLYNTRNIHMVRNNHLTCPRYILSISFNDNNHSGSNFTFQELVELYNRGLLINNTQQVQKSPKLYWSKDKITADSQTSFR